MNKKIYICTPLKEEKFLLDKISSEILKSGDFAFIPPTGQLLNKKVGAKLDKLMIEQCDELWAFGMLGRDCSWEIGYATGLNKKVKIFISIENKVILEEDWMLLIDAEIVEI